MKYLVALLCLAACACAAKLFEDCGSKSGKIKSVQFDGKDVCDVKSNTKVKVKIEFESTSSTSKKVTVSAVVSVSGKEEKVELDDSDGCRSGAGGLKCPLEEGKLYTYETTVEVKEFPTMSTYGRWNFKDDNDVDIVCIKVYCTFG